MSNARQAVLNRLHPISLRFVWLGLLTEAVWDLGSSVDEDR